MTMISLAINLTLSKSLRSNRTLFKCNDLVVVEKITSLVYTAISTLTNLHPRRTRRLNHIIIIISEEKVTFTLSSLSKELARCGVQPTGPYTKI